jgi:hypothetical protein
MNTPLTREFKPFPVRGGCGALAALFLLAGCAAAQTIQSDFSASNEGWSILGHSSNANPSNPAGISSSDLNPVVVDGMLKVQDIDSEWNWLKAPAPFLGNWSGYEEVRIDLVTDDYPTVHNLRLFITDGTNSAYHDFPLGGTPASAILSLAAPVRQAQWTVTGNWATLIANVTGFFIRIDLNNNVESEADFVDRIRLQGSALQLLIEPAFHLEFFGKSGLNYQIEGSADMVHWKNIGEVIAGTNALVIRSIRKSDQSSRFFRVVVVP